VYAADPELLAKGAERVGGIVDDLDDTTKLTETIHIDAVGHGPIAKAVHEQFTPAKEGLDKLVKNLTVALEGHREKTLALADSVRKTNEYTIDEAKGMRRPRGG
jgi:hypothetical protein